jgi:hypothetical protein
VTIRNAVPSTLNRRINAKISSAECVSRLPVGSSATSDGASDSARDRDPLLLPA